MVLSSTRLCYNQGEAWHDLGPVEIVDTDNVILELPRMFRVYSDDIDKAWETLKSGGFAGRFLVKSITDEGTVIAGEFWFEEARWCKDKDNSCLWLSCKQTRRKIIADDHLNI